MRRLAGLQPLAGLGPLRKPAGARAACHRSRSSSGQWATGRESGGSFMPPPSTALRVLWRRVGTAARVLISTW
jgi:hypothetical protein